jgi:ATP-binding cassette, subfamily B, bacterial
MGWWMHGVEEDDELSRADAGRILRRSFRLLRPYRGQVVVAGAVLFGSVAAVLAGPRLVAYAIDHGLNPKHFRVSLIDRIAVIYLGVAVAAFCLSRAQIVLVTRLGEQFLRDLRVKVFDHIQAMSMDFFDREPTGRLVARMTSDIDALEDLVQLGLAQFIQNALIVVFTVAVLLYLSPLLALVSFVALPPVIAASIKFRRDSNRAYLRVRDRISRTLSTLQEGLSGVRVIQAFAQEDSQALRFSRHNRDQYEANMDAVRISAWYFPVIELAGIGSTAAVVGIGGLLVHRHEVTIGIVGAFVLYLSGLFDPIQQLSQLFNTVQSAGAALSKLFGLLDTPSSVVEREGARSLPERGVLEVRGVSFAYGPDAPEVLSDVDLAVVPGERLALVGPTGAGKSTLAKLMARLYDPTAGSVAYADIDLREATFSSLRERIVVVPQEGYLFQGSIMDNVRLGRRGASDDEVRAALRRVGALARFDALPDGLATEVRERGSRLSAGERQLVSLARAALADAEVLVLDEATSNLDPGTEAEVEQAVDALMEGRTVVVIAHRLSTAERADRVAVVDGGRLVELGTHAELVAEGGRYASLFASWVGDGAGAGNGAGNVAAGDGLERLGAAGPGDGPGG